jgi:glycosyltransferase involved in cell wall biosynthesis
MDGRARFRPVADFLTETHDHLIYAFHDQMTLANKVDARHRYFYCLNLYARTHVLWPSLLARLCDRRAYYIQSALRERSSQKIANCTDIAKWITKYFHRPVPVVFGGINPEIFYPAPVTRDPKVIKIFSLGSPKYWKGTSFIVEAIELVKQKYPNVTLDGYYRKGLPQSKMAEAYSGADIFVDAQVYAGWNNPIAEAMACHVPVICYDLGFNKDIAIHRETALLVPPRDTQKLADAIIELIENPTLRDTLVRNASKTIAAFTWDSATDAMEKILLTAEQS